MIEGEWSYLGVYRHVPNQHPFSQSVDLYRSDRKGHLLKVDGTDYYVVKCPSIAGLPAPHDMR
jgi:hypothetical protein